MCKTCDAIQESKVKGQFLQDLCDCHEVTRWICGSCESKESEEFINYWRKFTVFEAGWDEFWEIPENVETRHLRDNPGIRAVSYSHPLISGRQSNGGSSFSAPVVRLFPKKLDRGALCASAGTEMTTSGGTRRTS